MKIAEKAQLAVAKKNIEGNHQNPKNSFAVLNNADLVVRSSKMGVDVSNVDMEQFDVLKDLEKARAKLIERNKDNPHKNENVEIEAPPLEEAKFIEWNSDSLDSEGF